MISLTRMDGKAVLVNEEWLLVVEENPDTTLFFAGGMKLIVKETRAELLQKVKGWQVKPGRSGRKPRRLT